MNFKMIVRMLSMFCTLNVDFDKGDAVHLSWPAGKYGLPNTMYNCPNAEGFTWASGNITQALNSKSKKSESSHLKATVTTKEVERSFCVKDVDSPDPTRPAWPAGKYCIYRKGGKCPAGLKQGSLLWDNRFVLSFKKNRGVVPDGRSSSSNTILYFCCAINGDKTSPIPLPLDSPFYLLAYQSNACQEVRGALHRTEFIFYDTDRRNKLTRPHPYDATTYSMKINYCYYQACWMNSTTLNGTIMSPFYPKSYPINTNCRWRIEVPVDYMIRLEFQDVDMGLSSSCTKDWLQVSTGNPATTILKFCTKKRYPSLVTRSNVVVLDFHSDGVASSNKGFKIYYQAIRVLVPMTTTSQATAVMTTQSTTNPTPVSTNISITTLQPTRMRTISEHVKTRPTGSGEQESTISSTKETSDATTFPLTNKSRPSSPRESPTVLEAREKQLPYAIWVIPVAVCLSILVATALGLLLYLKCLRKRNTIQRRLSTVKYNRKCDYVDMEIHRDEAFGIRCNPNLEVLFRYENYPSDDSEYSEPIEEDQRGGIYEEINDNLASSGKGQGDNASESMAVINDYDTPQKTSRAAHVYESAILPRR